LNNLTSVQYSKHLSSYAKDYSPIAKVENQNPYAPLSEGKHFYRPDENQENFQQNQNHVESVEISRLKNELDQLNQLFAKEHKKKNRYKQRAFTLREQLKIQGIEVTRLHSEVRRLQQ